MTRVGDVIAEKRRVSDAEWEGLIRTLIEFNDRLPDPELVGIVDNNAPVASRDSNGLSVGNLADIHPSLLVGPASLASIAGFRASLWLSCCALWRGLRA